MHCLLSTVHVLPLIYHITISAFDLRKNANISTAHFLYYENILIIPKICHYVSCNFPQKLSIDRLFTGLCSVCDAASTNSTLVSLWAIEFKIIVYERPYDHGVCP